MADYIYLLQNRLTPAQRRAVDAVREAARAEAMPVFLVGGAVRDLTSGSPVRDLDFAVQGDVERLVGALEASGATIVGRNAVLSSVYLVFRGGVRAEIGPTLSVSYPKPGVAEAHQAAILDDLRRRDFTANAMAVSLNEGSYGLLLDPLNGTADIENREFRLVSPYGFIENPALLLRAARLSDRLGWFLEERTEGRYQTGKEEGHLKALPAADRGYELEEIFHEEDPVAALEHLAAEGWMEQIFPALTPDSVDRSGIEGIRDLIGQLESQGIYPDPSTVYFPLLTARLQDQDRAALKAAFARPGFATRIDTTEERARELGNQLTSKAAAQPSGAWKLLKEAEPELVLWLAFHVRSGAIQNKIKAFLKEWPQMRHKLPYALMQEMRITPELPEYEGLLDDLFFALIDGKLDTPEATRAFLEPFSPPAPPQVSVRRRPAKAARGRAKKAAIEEEELAAESPEETEVGDAEGEGPQISIAEDGAEDVTEGAPSVATDVEPEPEARKVSATSVGATSEAGGSEPAVASGSEQTAKPVVGGSGAEAERVTPAKSAKKAASGAGGKRPILKKAPAKKSSAVKGAAPKKHAVFVPAGKPAKATKSAAKKVAAKKVVGSKPPVKAVAAKKIAGKAVAGKTAVKAGAKLPAKRGPAKKIAAKKVAAKSQPGKKTRGTVSVKRGAKSTKKAATKGRGGR